VSTRSPSRRRFFRLLPPLPSLPNRATAVVGISVPSSTPAAAPLPQIATTTTIPPCKPSRCPFHRLRPLPAGETGLARSCCRHPQHHRAPPLLGVHSSSPKTRRNPNHLAFWSRRPSASPPPVPHAAKSSSLSSPEGHRRLLASLRRPPLPAVDCLRVESVVSEVRGHEDKSSEDPSEEARSVELLS
jgi:hypothetical protein